MSVNKPFAYFRQPSGFGPYLECKSSDVGAFPAYHAAQPVVLPKLNSELLASFREGLAYMREKAIADFPDGVLELNGQFKKFMDPETDSAWIGFCVAMKQARAILAAKEQA